MRTCPPKATSTRSGRSASGERDVVGAAAAVHAASVPGIGVVNYAPSELKQRCRPGDADISSARLVRHAGLDELAVVFAREKRDEIDGPVAPSATAVRRSAGFVRGKRENGLPAAAQRLGLGKAKAVLERVGDGANAVLRTQSSSTGTPAPSAGHQHDGHHQLDEREAGVRHAAWIGASSAPDLFVIQSLAQVFQPETPLTVVERSLLVHCESEAAWRGRCPRPRAVNAVAVGGQDCMKLKDSDLQPPPHRQGEVNPVTEL